MRAVVVNEYGGPEVLTVTDVPDPTPGPDEILVRVAHSAVNRADTLQRQGGYPDPQRRDHEILGLEYAGTVAAVGDRVTLWQPGDRVMGIEAGACNAELLVTHERLALPVPESVDLADAAAFPEVFLTAWDALVVQGGLTSGRWALVHAGASGVGTAAIQIAKAIGARIAVTCSAGKIDACRELGADVVLERSPADWASELKSAVPGGVDVVLDVVGGEEANRNLASIKPQGTIVQVGLMGGAKTDVNIGLLLVKRATWIGTTLRSRPIEQKAAICQRFVAEMVPLIDAGVLRPVVDSRFELDRIADAHRHMEANANVGKILIDL
ncbi:putative PIG3 family NAD(P)H quinone oxidoreductase [Ilumatobacter fluminis]|uniref:Putative PIG3 family NAD(P)H quinone oxidoreductase n=1 Tax=Ilumatobacter fluminis TaxID=467091 RepID=A0A4R7HX68_9ACTN|nr:NAD(P)H-quinone oxidoreductase [Ilumatobacter fluminis]TDT15059.1 putative PIG3 family NAD(P)H quinone oxidoreductase [Ilumatobacter fluminis]